MKKILKVCGMRDADNIREVEALGIDWMGFICWSGSPRYVSEPPSYLPSTVKRVGVFVNPSIEDVKETITALDINLIQLHGTETPEFCRMVKNVTGLPVMKAFAISQASDLCATDEYVVADYFLFDTRTPLVGGSGRQFDWSILNAYDGSTPFLLSGGIGVEDVERLRAFNHPRCIGFDVNSRFELSPALKNVNLLRRFITELYARP